MRDDLTDRLPEDQRAHDAWDSVLVPGALRTVHQPLVDLTSGRVVGLEALLRGPRGSAWELPLPLLAAARAAGRAADLDLAAARSSLASAAASGAPTTLFVNVEPSTLSDRPAELAGVLADRAPQVQVVVELTERALAADPAAVLAGAERLREVGCAIALDDVGVEPESLAFIPLLRPEVVKLDLGLLRTVEDPATITVAGAVRAYAEATGAEVVAEGVETEDDLARALVVGATLGQGWHWGRPTEEPRPTGHEPERFGPRPVGEALCATPFDVVASRLRVHRAPKRLLLPLSRTVELAAEQSRIPPLLASTFQHHAQLTPHTARRYSALGSRLPFVAALGVAMPAAPADGVRGWSLREDDPLASEWTVVMLGPHEGVALVARDCGETGCADGDRPFDFVVTHDRDLVTASAHALVGQLGGR
ncbi:sensor domain-containing phosphodiesterase [Cellulomonas carbonis]|uniref:Phytochrome-like protein cph2 n=1 Tax=Cellulomonas carbonis T26 TaxID=947969 RepID=A0A0A0BNB8_9CELL|nr:EAL domain-containing protein [Cellulomonas carbonis]KGM09461.1 phytochrome-like protein cph2 [Cellulomonas carbonis T26]GGB94739.1 hypothetical protein GCM10010972_04300 [Cellulomonas carbonis]